ncbi:MAG: DUF4380 domain-containing protein [Abditibacteriales bacterium]|nr:DUF4380 domain-containing protein [Abditibacteriales bacterium]
MERINYKGWQNCYRLSNGIVDLIVTTDVGPRIIRFGFGNAENEFREYEEMMGKTGGDEWRIYGGHRLWHAPEEKPRTYFPDNAPVKWEQHPGFVRLIQPTETTTGIQKEMDIRLSPNAARVEVVHRLRNTNLWAVELAPWALTVMAPGGKGIVPLPPRGAHEENLLPTNSLTLWAYTDMTDPRWTWGSKYILLRQDSTVTKPQKIGVMASDGWAAYARNGHLFVKRFNFVKGATYPDFGASVEMFTNGDMLELETLGPLTRLPPGAAVEHVEHWFLFKDVPTPNNDADVEKNVLPKVRAAEG